MPFQEPEARSNAHPASPSVSRILWAAQVQLAGGPRADLAAATNDLPRLGILHVLSVLPLPANALGFGHLASLLGGVEFLPQFAATLLSLIDLGRVFCVERFDPVLLALAQRDALEERLLTLRPDRLSRLVVP